MKLSISAKLPTYTWYEFGGAKGLTVTNAKNKRIIRKPDLFGLRLLRNGKWNLVFPDNVRVIYLISDSNANSLSSRSIRTVDPTVGDAAPELIKPQGVANLDQSVIKGQWDADRFRPAHDIKKEVIVKGQGKAEQLGGDGIHTSNYQWRVLVDDRTISTNKGAKTLARSTWIGLRFIKASIGGKVVCRDGFFESVDTSEYDALVQDSRLLPKARWPDTVITPQMVYEYKRNIRLRYLTEKQNERNRDQALIRAQQLEQAKAKAEKAAQRKAEEKARLAQQQKTIDEAAQNRKELEEAKDDIAVQLKTHLDTLMKHRESKQGKGKAFEDMHESEDVDDFEDDEEEEEIVPKSDKKPETKPKSDKKKPEPEEEDDSEDEEESDDPEDEEDDSETEEEEDDSDDPEDEDLEDDTDHKSTHDISDALRGDSDDDEIDDEDLGDEAVPDEDDDAPKKPNSNKKHAEVKDKPEPEPEEEDSEPEEEEDSEPEEEEDGKEEEKEKPDEEDKGTALDNAEDQDDDAKKAEEEESKVKNRVSDGKSEEGQVVVFKADKTDKVKYLVLSVDQHHKHDHLYVYRLYDIDSKPNTIREVRINKQRGQKLSDLAKTVSTLDNSKLNAVISKTADYEVDKKPITS